MSIFSRREWRMVPTMATLGFVCALTAPATAQTVEDYWPEVVESPPIECNDLPGISLFRYHNIDRDGRWNRYFLTETCFSPDKLELVGAETISGMTKIQPAPGFLGRYEVLTDGETRVRRRSFGIAPVMDEMSMEGGAPREDWSVFHMTSRIPTRQVTRYEGMTEATMHGYAFRNLRDDLDALPEGLWQIQGAADFDHRLTVDQPVEPRNLNLGGWIFLVDVRADGTSIYPPMTFPPEASMSMDVAAGKISGAITFGVSNPVNLEARNPDAWDTAEVQINRLFGRVVEDEGKLVLVAVGTGRVVLFDEEGQTAVENGSIQFTGYQVPDQMTDEILMPAFPGFPGR
ncbi:hypothetical protein KHP62_19025 [Rhodobacteraceae bacterium NNCM2]|nr:hypothetical protein [Coraliihabitans acroporae]